jgi:PIN domain nuclease of toxin-antitoxin system
VQALALCQDQQNSLVLSVASVWEMQIKLQLSKLKLTLPLSEIIDNQQQTNHLEILPILLPHVLAVHSLPAHHKDPFDRILIAQATVEDVIIVSNDPMFPKYTNKVLW